MLDQDTAIHHDKDSGRTGFLCGFFVDNFFLHPDGGNFQLDRLINNFFHEFRPAKNVNDVDLLGNIEQRRDMPFLPTTL